MGTFRYAERSLRKALDELDYLLPGSAFRRIISDIERDSLSGRMTLLPSRRRPQDLPPPDVPIVFTEGEYISPIVTSFKQMEQYREKQLGAWERSMRARGEVPDYRFRGIHEYLSTYVRNALQKIGREDLPPVTPQMSDIAWILHVYGKESYPTLMQTFREDQGVSLSELSRRMTTAVSNVGAIEKQARDGKSVGMARVGGYLKGLDMPLRSPYAAAVVSQIARDGYRSAQNEIWNGETASFQEVMTELLRLPSLGVVSFGTYIRHLRGQHIRENSELTWTQQDLATYSGLPKTNIVAIELGENKPNVLNFYKPLRGLGYSPGSKETIVAGILALEAA